MLGWMRCAASRAAYSAQAYCTPRSLWWMTLPKRKPAHRNRRRLRQASNNAADRRTAANARFSRNTMAKARVLPVGGAMPVWRRPLSGETSEATRIPKFKEALERGKEARRQQEEHARNEQADEGGALRRTSARKPEPGSTTSRWRHWRRPRLTCGRLDGRRRHRAAPPDQMVNAVYSVPNLQEARIGEEGQKDVHGPRSGEQAGVSVSARDRGAGCRKHR